MISREPAAMLARYNAWGNKLMFDTVAALPEGEVTKERKSLFRNMVHTLNHNYVIDRIWQAHLEGGEHGYTARNTQDHPPLAELWRVQQDVDSWYIAWSDAQSDAALDEEFLGKSLHRLNLPPEKPWLNLPTRSSMAKK